MKKTNYIPAQGGKFLDWTKVLMAYVMLHGTSWRLDPAMWAELEILLREYEQAYEKAEAPNRGSVDVLVKNEKRRALEKAIRQFVKEYLMNNHLVTDEDRKQMGLPIHDTKPTQSPVSAKSPFATTKSATPGVIEFHFGNQDGKKGNKEEGEYRVEMAWAILEVKPLDWEELVHSSFATRSPLKLSFKGTERGKTLYFALRWENTRGEKGPWSEMMTTIIP
jgi:hypothetical protein